MVDGHFVGHPHVGECTVHLHNPSSPITAGLPATFPYCSEQYYLLVDPDPGVHVHCECGISL
jgi:type 1 glutamine amidotransferase